MMTFKFGTLSSLLLLSMSTVLRGVQGESHLRGLSNHGFDEQLGQCSGATCSLWGDPHIITCDGLAYDCQGHGIFTIMKNHLYNIQGHFLPVGAAEMNLLVGWNLFPVAAVTNDVIIDYAPDDDNIDVPVMQFSFPDLSNHDGTFAGEEGCVVGEHYYPHDMPGQSRSVETSLAACRERCENVAGCTKFQFWGDGGCHVNNDNQYPTPSPASWSRSVSGPLSSCGLPPPDTTDPLDDTDELGKSGSIGNSCPLLFYLDGELQDIHEVNANGYLYGSSTSDHSAQLVGDKEIHIVHKSESGTYSEAKLVASGEGPGQLWGCHWDFHICLPEAEQQQFEEFSVGLFGTPDGNTQNDWMDSDGNSLDIPNNKKGQAAFDYCRDNWCVSQEDSMMAYPVGTTYEDFKCIDEEYIDFDVNDDMCVISSEKIIEKCAEKPPLLVHSCQVDCCFGGCGHFDEIVEEIGEITTLSVLDEDIVFDFPVLVFLDPICSETYKASTSETACPSSNNGIVTVISETAEIPEGEPILFGIVIQESMDEDIGRTVKFRVDNPFVDHADIFVSYSKKVGTYAMDKACDSMLETAAGCDPNAPEITVGCHEYPGVDPFAIVDVYFASNEDPFVLGNAAADTEVEKCCKPPDAYENGGYGVIKYTFKIECTCPEEEDVVSN